MSPDSIPQFSLGTAALIIFLVCAGFVMLRGMAKMLTGTAVLCASAWIAFFALQQAPGLSVAWMGKSVDWFTIALPCVAFAASFFAIRKTIKIVVSPFGESEGEEDSFIQKTIRFTGRTFLILIPTALICLIGAAIVHHTGSVAEIQAFTAKTHGKQEPTTATFGQRLKASIEGILPEPLLRTLDPLADPNRLTLAKVIAAQSKAPLKPVIDPATGKPIPRATIVEDPELQNLAREGKFGTLLRHPQLTKALNDPQLKALLKDLHL